MINGFSKKRFTFYLQPKTPAMENAGIQLMFFHLLRQRLPSHISLADEIAALLHISEDSAYRRIRGEKQMGFDELELLCSHFRISLDPMLGLPTRTVVFSGNYIRPDNFDYHAYLNRQQQELRGIGAARQKEITFLCKDIPVYHYFLFPEIASFKYFSWRKMLYDFPSLKGRLFSLDAMQDEPVSLGHKVAEAYYQVPGTEILNPDNILTTLRQIEYFKDACLFSSPSDLDRIYQSLHNMVDHMEEMARKGKKFIPGKDASLSPGDYRVYVNEFYVGDNMLLVQADELRRCFLVHSGTNFISTDHDGFMDYQQEFVNGLIKRSVLISSSGEKERSQFFKGIRERINAYRDNRIQTLAND